MRFIKKPRLKEVPNVGDLVEYNGEVYLLIYDEFDNMGYSYKLISLISGKVRHLFVTMEFVANHCKLVSKNENLELKF